MINTHQPAHIPAHLPAPICRSFLIADLEAEAFFVYVNDTELIQRGGGYSQRGDGENCQSLRSSPLTFISKDIRVWGLVERLRDLLSKRNHTTQDTSVSSTGYLGFQQFPIDKTLLRCKRNQQAR